VVSAQSERNEGELCGFLKVLICIAAIMEYLSEMEDRTDIPYSLMHKVWLLWVKRGSTQSGTPTDPGVFVAAY
jgi:hypothetical protein